MGRDLTKRYVDEVLEVSGIRKKGAERIREISQMPDQEIRRLLEDIAGRASNHYKKNLPSIVGDLRGLTGQPKAYYFGPWTALRLDVETPDRFIRKSALYYNKIVIIDLTKQLLISRVGWKPIAIKNAISAWLESLYLLWPWIKEGIIEMIPSLDELEGLGDIIDRYAEEDFQDTGGWLPQVLRHEDYQLEGKSWLRCLESFLQERVSSDFIEKIGGLRAMVLYLAANATSREMGHGFFGSWLTGSSPITDLKRDWRLFGYWSSRRAEGIVAHDLGRDQWGSFVRKMKVGRAWLALDAKELGVLSKLPPRKIIEIRDSADYSFRYFREDLGYAVDKIEGLKLDDEKAYREAAEQVWSKVRDDARNVKRDMDTIRRKIELDVDVSFMSLILGLLPFDIAKLATALLGGATVLDIAGEYLTLKGLKKSTGYFLVKLEESGSQMC